MPAMLDDPDSPTIYRTSGKPPYPDPGSSSPSLPSEVLPRRVTLRDRQTTATVIPFASKDQVPPSLLRYLADQFNKEIEGGDTYPMTDPMSYDKFANYWFQNFGAIMLLGSVARAEDVALLREAGGPGLGAASSSSGTDGNSDASHDPGATTPTPTSTSTSDPDATPGDWSRRCLGSFYIKPNYPGRSSHVCNAGFLTTDASRNRGVGRLMGESYLDWAPRLGYTYSVFNLVYETNVASCRIWDALGFKRIGRVKGCGNLRSYPGQLVDALIYGRDLVPGEFPEDLVSEERFDKIKFYLKFGKYPAGADRAEKSRLRSAATHYKLVDGERLMLKDKEVVPDPRRQYDIAREVHAVQHGGINKTTATIAEKYHWSRIKETVSDVIKNCAECKELGKTGPAAVDGSGVSTVPGAARSRIAGTGGSVNVSGGGSGSGSPTTNTSPLPANPAVATSSALREPGGVDDNTRRTDYSSPAAHFPVHRGPDPTPAAYSYPSPEPNMAGGVTPSHTLRDPSASPLPRHQRLPHHNPMLQDQPAHHHHHQHGPHAVYQPIDPQMIDQPPHSHHDGDPYAPYAAHHHHHEHGLPRPDHQTETDFQALLNATSESDQPSQMQDQDAGPGHNHHNHNSSHHDQHHDHFESNAEPVSENSGRTGMEVDAAAREREREREREAVDRDLDMLIEQGDGIDDEELDDDETMAGMAGVNEQLRRGSAARQDGPSFQDEVAQRPGRGPAS